MQTTKNVIIVPPYYTGTSFSDIVSTLRTTVKKNHFPIQFIGELQPLPNEVPFGQLDDEKFTRKSLGIIQSLITFPDSTNFLFIDLYALSLDALLYSRSQKLMRNCRYGALVHGGSFLANDLYSWSWLPLFEQAWALSMDRLYVPSQYLFRQLPKEWKRRARVLPWGVDGMQKSLDKKQIKYDVVFPHRLDSDKGVKTLIAIVRGLPKINFVLTTPQSRKHALSNPYTRKLLRFSNVRLLPNLNDKDHKMILQQSKMVLSCATQENFGYAIIKSVLAGCVPIVPDQLCYPEYIPKIFRYDSTIGAIEKIVNFSRNSLSRRQRLQLNTAQNKVDTFSFESILRDFFRL